MLTGAEGGPLMKCELQPGGVWGERLAESALVISAQLFGFTT